MLCLLLAAGLVAPATGAAAQTPTELAYACPDGSVPEDGFLDVVVVDAHEYAIDCLAWWGVAEGRAADRYRPKALVSRAQVASLVARSLEAAGVDLPDDPDDHFDDDNQSVHELSINQAAAYGVFQGTASRTFSPAQPVTRAQMATVLVRAHEQAIGSAVTVTRDWFDDDNGHLHEANINKLAELGINRGWRVENRFTPSELVLRDQTSSFLARLLDRLVADDVAVPPAASPEGQTGNDGDPCDVSLCPAPYIYDARAGNLGDREIGEGDLWEIMFSEPLDNTTLDFEIEIRAADSEGTDHDIRFNCATAEDFTCRWTEWREGYDVREDILYVLVHTDTGLFYPAAIQDLTALSRDGRPLDWSNPSNDRILQ